MNHFMLFIIKCKKKKKLGGSMGGLSYIDFLAKFGVGGAHPGGIHLTKNVLSKENITEESFILDAGCGTGQTAAFLYQEFKAIVYGLEINPIMLEKAKNRFQALNAPVQLVKGSVEEIPFEDHTFDFIISESVLAFVNKPAALKEFSRVLKKEGRLIANEMTINTKLSPEAQKEIMKFYDIDSLLMENDWRSLLEKAGFTNIDVKSEQIALTHGNHAPEFNFSKNLEPELFEVLNQHGFIIVKYSDNLSYRIITCNKR